MLLSHRQFHHTADPDEARVGLCYTSQLVLSCDDICWLQSVGYCFVRLLAWFLAVSLHLRPHSLLCLATVLKGCTPGHLICPAFCTHLIDQLWHDNILKLLCVQ